MNEKQRIQLNGIDAVFPKRATQRKERLLMRTREPYPLRSQSAGTFAAFHSFVAIKICEEPFLDRIYRINGIEQIKEYSSH